MGEEMVKLRLIWVGDGEPALLVSPRCKTIRKGFNGAYKYRRLQVAGDERYQDKPDKNAYSHPHDAVQYLCLGMGDGHVITGAQGTDWNEPINRTRSTTGRRVPARASRSW